MFGLSECRELRPIRQETLSLLIDEEGEYGQELDETFGCPVCFRRNIP